MRHTTRTVVVAAVLALAVCTGAALGSAATTTTTDEQTNETATVSFNDQEFDGESVTIDSATLPDGGFAVVYDEESNPVGYTDYLDAGDHENLSVSLDDTVEGSQVFVATLYRNNGTETYNASEDSEAYQTGTGTNVTDVAFVTSENQSEDETTDAATDDETDGETTETETDEAANDETTEAPADDESGDEETDESSGGIPGFTPITAVVALLAAALIASRRR